MRARVHTKYFTAPLPSLFRSPSTARRAARLRCRPKELSFPWFLTMLPQKSTSLSVTRIILSYHFRRVVIPRLYLHIILYSYIYDIIILCRLATFRRDDAKIIVKNITFVLNRVVEIVTTVCTCRGERGKKFRGRFRKYVVVVIIVFYHFRSVAFSYYFLSRFFFNSFTKHNVRPHRKFYHIFYTELKDL